MLSAQRIVAPWGCGITHLRHSRRSVGGAFAIRLPYLKWSRVLRTPNSRRLLRHNGFAMSPAANGSSHHRAPRSAGLGKAAKLPVLRTASFAIALGPSWPSPWRARMRSRASSCASAPAPAPITHRAARLAHARVAPGGSACHAPGHEGARGASQPLQALKTVRPIISACPGPSPSSEGVMGRDGRRRKPSRGNLCPCEKREDPSRTPHGERRRVAPFFSIAA